MGRALRIIGWTFGVQAGVLLLWTAWNVRHSLASLVLIGIPAVAGISAIAWSVRSRKAVVTAFVLVQRECEAKCSPKGR
jgi:hypothetical protein